MKKFVSAVCVAAVLAGANAFACGGMTHLDPPALKIAGGDTPPTTTSILSLGPDHNLVLC